MQGGIIEMEVAINSSKVIYSVKNAKGYTRISHKLLEDGAKSKSM